MPSQQEQSLGARSFRGVNVAVDPVFLDPRDLQSSENWVPSDLTLLLTKRRGTTTYAMVAAPVIRIDAMLRTYDQAVPFNRLLFLVENSSVDQLAFTANDGAVTLVTGGAFVAVNGRYGMAVLGNKLYVSNGDSANDPYLKVIDLSTPGTASNLGALGATNEAGFATVAVAAAGTMSQLPSGTYAYAWAVYDTNTQFYISRGIPRTIPIGQNSFIQFTAPNTALAAGRVYQLFVAPVNLPVEFASSQVPDGLAAAAVFTLNEVSTSGPLVPLAQNVARTGRFLVAHRQSLFIAGDKANRSAVYQTGQIQRGLEQTIYNQGTFFPAFAIALISPNDGDEITGMGVVSLTTTQQSPAAPLAVFKNNSAYLLIGDLNDPNTPGELIQLSRSIGCVAHATIVNTPAGLIFCGHESVYLLRPELTEPTDIGWPIAPIIRGIPNSAADRCFAILHNGFYKLYITPPGGSAITQSWWLDLHRQTIDDPPSWWGPHVHGISMTATISKQFQVHAATVGYREPDESERAWVSGNPATSGAIWNGAWNGVWALSSVEIALLDQPHQFTDQGPTVVSRLKTRAFDAGNPFQRKLFTGMRVNARAAGSTSLDVAVRYDGALASTPPSMQISKELLGEWAAPDGSIGVWNGSWGMAIFNEGDTRLSGPLDRQPHVSAEVTLTHSEALAIDLRDFELRYIPVERQVQ